MSLIGRDGRRYPLDEPRWRGEDGSPLLVEPLAGIRRADVDVSVRSHWRYARALPLALEPITLGEGWTPLLPTRIAGVDLLLKPEWFNPTGSFKDRGTSVMVSLLAHQGIPAILEDSSGNGGASVAAYAAAAGIHAKILAPESISEAKLLQSRTHGAELELVPGPRQATADEAVRQSDRRFYSSHNWHPFFLQGTKLIAYEIWEQLGFRAPDAVLMPTGAGSLALGCSIGFNELKRAGEIERLPRLLVVQPANCSPLARAFATGTDEARDGDWRPTIAEGTSIARPVRDREVLQAVRESGGTIVAVEEDAIAPAVRALAARGLYAEPTSAIIVAALDQLAIERSDTVVAVLTGSGLKAATAMARILDR
nr:pyridoxal-phosphate dependent enzyme [Solirubrobacter soli]